MTSKERSNTPDGIQITQLRIAHPTQIQPGLITPSELFLEKGAMRKPSFIELNHIYKVSASQLRDFRLGDSASNSRLSEESYEVLMASLDMEKEEWVTSADLGFRATMMSTVKRSKINKMANKDKSPAGLSNLPLQNIKPNSQFSGYQFIQRHDLDSFQYIRSRPDSGLSGYKLLNPYVYDDPIRYKQNNYIGSRMHWMSEDSRPTSSAGGVEVEEPPSQFFRILVLVLLSSVLIIYLD
jgi:hypothetical protein